MLLWDAALEEQSAATPAFCAANRTDADLTVIAERGRAAVLTGPAGRGSAKDAARRAMIAAFPCQGEPTPVSAAAVDRAAETLGAVWEQQHGEDARAESAARRAAYEAATGADYQRMCASRDPGEDGFCAGILFAAHISESRSASPAFCAPEYESREATGRFVAGAKAGVAQVRVSAGQSPSEVARAGLIQAYPCDTTPVSADAVSAPAPTRRDVSSVRAANDLRPIMPAHAVEVARIELDKTSQDGQTPATTEAPVSPAENDFLAERRAERAATRDAWPSERGLRLPGWPRPERPGSRSPFNYERQANQPQNARVRGT